MQEMLLSALVAYQLNQGLEARVTTSPHRSYILHQYQRRSETSKPQEPRVYNARQLQMSSFNQSQIPERDQGTLPNKVRKTLVIAPHPDDEIICCGTLMSERVKNGEKVQVIYLTDGDALSTRDSDISKRYGKGRRKESIKAMAEIGVDESYLAFLNFPDGYLDVLDDEILTSAYTGQNSSKTATHFNHTVYRRSDLERNLRRLIRGAGADEIYIPSWKDDDHPDHQVTSRLVIDIVSGLRKNEASIFEYVVHNPKRLQHLGALDEEKLHLLRMFKSQFHDQNHTQFMESFAQIPESFDLWIRGRLARKD